LSQIYKSGSSSGPVPPTVATSYVTDVNSPAIPALNVLDVFGGSSTSNVSSGIQTDGSSGSNVLTVQLTNRATATLTTSDDTQQALLTFPLSATPSTYLFEIKVVAFDVTDSLSAGYNIIQVARGTGAICLLINPTEEVEIEEGAMSGAIVNCGAAGNTFEVLVEGLAGKTIHWLGLLNYITVS